MILTGKAKDEFESYFLENHEDEDFPILKSGINLLQAFEQVPLSMQLGVYIDWFDSVGIRIIIGINPEMNFIYNINGEHCDKEEGYSDRCSARVAALGQAAFLFNSESSKEKPKKKKK